MAYCILYIILDIIYYISYIIIIINIIYETGVLRVLLYYNVIIYDNTSGI